MRWIDKELGYVEDFYDEYNDEYINCRYEDYRNFELDDEIDFNFGEIEKRLSDSERVILMDSLGLSNSDIEMGLGKEMLSSLVKTNEIEIILEEMDLVWNKHNLEKHRRLKNGFDTFESRDSHRKVIRCNSCNQIRYVDDNDFICNECGFKGDSIVSKRSNGELLVEKLLKKHNLEFRREVKEFGRYRFDFVVEYNHIKYYIEVNGLQHYKPIDYFGGERVYKETILRDEIKREYAVENGVYIALDYKEHNLELLKERFDKEFLNKYINKGDR